MVSVSSVTGTAGVDYTTGTSGGYTWYRFFTNQTITFGAGGSVDICAVGGGGGGGGGSSGATGGGGGGGGGGVQQETGVTVTAAAYSVIIGAGGSGNSGGNAGVSGGFSDVQLSATTILSNRADGGGGGGSSSNTLNNDGLAGGSVGGNGGRNTDVTQDNSPTGNGTGNAGGIGGSALGNGRGGGGGGGAGSAGGDGTDTTSVNFYADGGDGGTGVTNDWTGSTVTLAAGGGGAGQTNSFLGGSGVSGVSGDGAAASAATSGTDGTGGGGGGGHQQELTGGDGGDGTVIIRFLTPSSGSGLLGGGLSMGLGLRLGGGAAAAPFSITLLSVDNQVAPAQVIVEASKYPADQYQFEWDFADSDSDTNWSNLTADMDIMGGRSRSTRYGKSAAHVYSTANVGQKTITCTVRDRNGIVDTATKTITILDPDVVFSGTDTVCIDPSGSFTGAPSGSSQYTSLATAVAAGLDGKRVLFAAGQTFDKSDWGGTQHRWQDYAYYGRFGTGSNPVFNIAHGTGDDSFFPRQIVKQTVFDRIDIVGDYDPSVTTLVPDTSGIVLTVVDPDTPSGNECVTIYGCSFSGLRQCVYLAKNINTVVADCHMTSWGDYGVFSSCGGHIGIVGCRIQQQTDAQSGSDGKDVVTPYYADHGPIRLSVNDAQQPAPKINLVQQCQLFSRNGWSSSGLADQACLRWNQGGGVDNSANIRGVINQCIMEGGWGGPLKLSSQNDATDVVASAYVVVERNYFLNTANDQQVMHLDHGNITLQNNIFVVPEMSYSIDTDIRVENALDSSFSGAYLRFRNNSFVVLYSDAALDFSESILFAKVDAQTRWSEVTKTNNVFHAPNLNSGAITTYAPFEASGNVYTPLYDGERYETSTPTAGTATPAGTALSWKHVAASSAAEAAATGTVPVDDFDGTIRSGSTSVGAYHTGA